MMKTTRCTDFQNLFLE